MKQRIGLVSLVVRDYDEALDFFVGKLGFQLVEDTYIPAQAKRWVVICPPGAIGSRLLLARASSAEQAARVGTQAGGRVFLFLYTDDFWRDYELYKARGIEFVRPPKEEPYGTVAVFKDLYGNQWDLLQPIEEWPGRVAQPQKDARSVKMYILVRESVPTGFAVLAAAHASLACHLKFRDTPEVAAWLAGPFHKVVCRVTDAEFEAAKGFEGHVVLTESGLGGAEVAIAFRPREEWPKAFKFYRLYR